MYEKKKAGGKPASNNFINVTVSNSTPIEMILSKLHKAHKSSKAGSWMARCPAHEDRNASLSVKELEDGRVLIHCFGGCKPLDILEALGLEFFHLFPSRLTDLTIKPEKKPFTSWEVLIALRDEVIRVYIIGRDILECRHSAENQERLGLALERINAGIAATGERHV